ncbi:hypothetical protein GCM10009017_25620 [Halarchaeum rubridurum]|uniref:Uncharacterized protein n=2 Tax=Halarchaeum rubridurum TaxID=489911 RepID=A0A830G4S3_9EURY|nr:hypothetical protein GCM10009017_25620 [Halarchaeum rubridurum]
MSGHKLFAGGVRRFRNAMTPIEWALVLVVALVIVAAVLYLVDNELLLELVTEVVD